MKILVTGAAGSVGTELVPRLKNLGHMVTATDLAWYDRHLDVTNDNEVRAYVKAFRPEVVFHLAGAKHAPHGEENPAAVARTNIQGTERLVHHADQLDAKVIFSSTCKAADPETAYGASKLIAERIVLNAGGVVVRFYNIPESQGNVFRLWEQLPEDRPIPWTDCWRYFIPMEQALELLLAAMELPSGRYIPDGPLLQHMYSVALERYPHRELEEIPRRRGDRRREPRMGSSEYITRYGRFLQITSPHDQAA